MTIIKFLDEIMLNMPYSPILIGLLGGMLSENMTHVPFYYMLLLGLAISMTIAITNRNKNKNNKIEWI